MSEIKKYDSKDESIDLKSADAQKKDSSSGVNAITGDAKKIKILSNVGSDVKRKKTPIAADIIAGLLIVLIAVAVVVGTVYLFKYQSNDYGTVEVEYKMVGQCENETTYYRPMRNKSIYLDKDNNSICLGKVTNVEFRTDADGNNVAILTVITDVKYRKNDGYTIDNNRIAVGSAYSVRSENVLADGVIVELEPVSARGGK